jgi:hypothetical protein
MVTVSPAAARNWPVVRKVYRSWWNEHRPPFSLEDGWVRLVAAVETETGCRVLGHTGKWVGRGGRINSRQEAVLAGSAAAYLAATGREVDGLGDNGGSVGILQQIPTEVAWLTTVGGLDSGAPRPWAGWGPMVDCMKIETSVPKFLDQLRVTDDPKYLDKVTASPIVADLLRIQRPLSSEVAVNYGASLVERARALAAQYAADGSDTPAAPTPPAQSEWWSLMAENFDEAKAELQDVMRGSKPVLVRDGSTGWYYLVAPGLFRIVKNGAVSGIHDNIGQDLVVATAVSTGLWSKSVDLNVIQIAALRLASFDQTPDSIYNNGTFY